MNVKFYLIFVFLLAAAAAWSQGRQVTGRVLKQATSEPLVGVTVAVKGQTTRTTTNTEGRYTISVPAGSPVLVFSYVGHKPQEVTVGAQGTVDIKLEEEAAALSDVVVVGYATVRRRDVTGSVSSVSAKQLKDVPLSNAAEAITGRLAGVQVTTSEGSPGADVQIRIRGGGSITQDNSPIYIVDGVQVENALSVISPQDIANIDVLKDASTTAIYGARGANGVVIITTKSGRAGKTTVTYNGTYGFRKIARKMDVLDPYEFVTYQWERARTLGDTSFNRIYGSTWDTLNVYKNIDPVNWQEEVFGRRAPYQLHNLSVNGGSGGTTFNLSLTANNEKGVMIESGFRRNLVNFKLDHKASDKFRVGMTVRYIDQLIKGAGTSSTGSRTTGRLRHSIQYRPFELPRVATADPADDEAFRNSAGLTNPVVLTRAEYRRGYTRGTNVSGYFSYNLLKNLTFRSNLGYDATNTRSNFFSGSVTSLARNNASLPVVQLSNREERTVNISNTLQYTLNGIADKHDFDALIGQEIYEFRYNTQNNEVRNFPVDIEPEKAFSRLSLGTSAPLSPSAYVSVPSRIFSLFGRINYSFAKRILGSFTLRADRSNKFAFDKGALLFPSGTLAWRFSQEKFMEPLPFITDAKLRVGFGTAGNNRIGDLLFLQLYSVTGQYALNHTVVSGYAPSSLANANLQWERNVSQNVGLDLSFLKNRLSLTVDAYRNKGNDLLLSVNIPPTSGYTQQIQNVGATLNRGLEFQLNATPVSNKTFSWSSNFNLAFNRNKVVSLGPITETTRSAGWQGSDGADDYLVKVGEPVGLMYGFVTDGWYQISDFDYNATTGAYTLKPGVPNSGTISGVIRPGALKIKDINNDTLINNSDRTVIGRANPKFTGGWNNQFNYGPFDFSVFVNFVYGNDIYNANKIEWTDASFPGTNVLGVMRDRWRYINDQGQVVTDPAALARLNENVKIWSPVNSNRYFLNSWAVEDGSFLRVNNVTLGYTLPGNLLKRIRAASLRVFVTANNLATITNYSGYDPEVNTRRSDPLTPGVDFAGYPRTRTYVGGINLSF
ncbi:TonB-dependent receptor [Paraflavisolibacter sp. H34]|uniref:SusC/RagA family TonB-linked outer membrane protein n=1 Tax=Huijunlia imazamoxiresistens TaxID=3127457 RepID=UPI003015CB86